MDRSKNEAILGTERSDVNVARDMKAFSGLLDLGEEVHARCETIRRQLSLWLGAGVLVVLISAAAMASYTPYIGADYLSPAEFFRTPIILVLASLMFAVYMGTLFLYWQYRRQIRRERRALHEVMSVIHEVLGSSEMHMSPLEIAQVRIRLSRMDN